MIKKILKKYRDDKQFSTSYHYINTMKGVEPVHKLLLNEMCNDAAMNGYVTWKHQTYGDRLGMSRRQVLRHFQTYESLGILTAHSDNIRGGKKNKFQLNLHNIVKLTCDAGGKKKKNLHVTPEVTTCDAGGTLHVTPEVKTCDTGVAYTKNTKTITKNIQKEIGSFEEPSPRGKIENELNQMTQQELERWLDDLDI